MPEPYIAGPKASVMDYLVHVWEHYREPFDRLLMRPIPELETRTVLREDGLPVLDEDGDPKAVWENIEAVSESLCRRHGRELLSRGFLVPLARDGETWQALFKAAQVIAPLDPKLVEKMLRRQEMVCTFELRRQAGMTWKSEYDVEWLVWFRETITYEVFEGDFGRFDAVLPEELRPDLGDEEFEAINRENALREKLYAALKASHVDVSERVRILQELLCKHDYESGWQQGFSETWRHGLEAGREAGERGSHSAA
jgi:hypothetical protein